MGLLKGLVDRKKLWLIVWKNLFVTILVTNIYKNKEEFLKFRVVTQFSSISVLYYEDK